jgi:hypothetical protein
MSLPSYQLSKNAAGVWVCSGAMPGSGRPFRFEAGNGTKDRAEGIVEQKLRAKVASSTGSRARWAKWKAAGSPPSSSASSPPSPPPAPSRPADEDLRAKLLGLGDAQPIAPVEVIPPDSDGQPAGAPGEPDENDPNFDAEGQELIASLIAKGATFGLVAGVNSRLRRRKPPQEGEPHEYGLKKFHDGIEIIAKKLVGRTATLGPVGQIFVGGVVIVGSMYMSAEPVGGAPAAAAAAPAAEPPPAPAPPAEHHATNGTTTPPAAPAVTALALGVFGVEKRTAN